MSPGPEEGHEEETGALGPDHEAETARIQRQEHPPTEGLPPDVEPATERLGGGGTHETQVQPPADDGGHRRGVITLVASIVISLVLVGAYIAAGGLNYKPSAPANPCSPHKWTKPKNLEETAQQFAISAADGAACKLGVSREEVIRALADDQSRQQFADDHNLSDSDIDDAFRAGLNRAVDDAQDAGAIGGLAATGLKAAISVAPTSVMIDLIENSGKLFSDGSSGLDSLESLGNIGSVSGAINAITGGSDDSSGGSGDNGASGSGGGDGSGATGLGGDIDKVLPDSLKNQIDQNLPQGTRKDLENKAAQALDNAFGQ